MSRSTITPMARERLLCAKGTVPIEYGGERYNIPVTAYAPSDFPNVGRRGVTPTRDDRQGESRVRGGGWRGGVGEVDDVERAIVEHARGGERMAEAFSVERPVFRNPTGRRWRRRRTVKRIRGLFSRRRPRPRRRGTRRLILARIRPRETRARRRFAETARRQVSNRRGVADDESEGGRRGRGGPTVPR